ncbi:LacI family transcriptional regulator [Lederbergia sp. NSJ-179]|uniref:LacI family DNA-binding transcriptional regulator n=1 Tax=Lederbergia sp. NSJ-179 TaxID=2931402 RepID=UPI001FCFEC87|nr:LacI family DNA-binding transcriptional regulator [Lederbergia sp. NSJ-179]MCJ7841495.1 LacI family transcriptional regulator [Lederbergia sp. NSJ-179]
MVSIKDIAKKAGVSISTVSYALNGSPKVTEKTSKKILEIAKDLNYVPNAAARTLKKRASKIIGAFMPDYGGPFFGDLLRGMRKTFNQKGYDLIACTGKESHRFLPEGIIDGAIILDWNFPDKEILRYADLGSKIVVLDRKLYHPNIEHVLLDNRTGTQLALNYLIEKKHQDIVFLTGPENNFDSKQRLQTALEILKEHPHIDYTIYSGNFGQSFGEEVAKEFKQKSTPIAIFSFNDDMAVGLYQGFKKTPYKIGKDIHIIGFDNIEVSKYLQPPLTTINYSKQEWGSVAAKQLLQLLDGNKTQPQLISVRLLERQSVNENQGAVEK